MEAQPAAGEQWQEGCQQQQERQPAQNQRQQQQGYTGFALQEQLSDGEPSDDEVQEVEPPPHCSICKSNLVQACRAAECGALGSPFQHEGAVYSFSLCLGSPQLVQAPN
jgi:hypothetical protein